MISNRKDTILIVLNVVSWVIFIGLCIEAGALVFNFILTLVIPQATHNIYKGLDLSELYEQKFQYFIGVMSFVLIISILKAYLFYFVVKIFLKLNLVKPFNSEIAKLIEKLSFEALAIAIVSIIANQYTKRIIQSGYELSHIEKYWSETAAFLMMAAILFVISEVFKKGIQLQRENDLTI